MRRPAAISWSATMGLIPGYAHDNDPVALDARRHLLVHLWNEAMEDCHARTGFSVSCVMTDATVLYRAAGGCPDGGERAVLLTGSTNPRYVKRREFPAFARAVEDVVRRVQRGMDQTSCRIEFSEIAMSVYSREQKLDASHPAPDRKALRAMLADRFRHTFARLATR
jgi:hypothetical protein